MKCPLCVCEFVSVTVFFFFFIFLGFAVIVSEFELVGFPYFGE